jgi:hypothetical protein
VIKWLAVSLGALALAAWSVLRVEALAYRLKKVERHMGQTDDRLTAIDAATTKVGSFIKDLKDQLARGEPVTPEQLAHMDAIANSLNAMASNPTNVVPVPVPDAPPNP